MDTIKLQHREEEVEVTIETGDVLVVCNGRWPLARAIKIVTYGRDRRKIERRAHHTGMFLVQHDLIFVREMDRDKDLKRMGDQWTPWHGEKYQGGKAKDRTLLLLKPKVPYENPIELEKDLISFQSRYSIRRLFQHLKRWITGTFPALQDGDDGNVCSQKTAYIINKHKGLFPRYHEASPRDVLEVLGDHYHIYVLNDAKS